MVAELQNILNICATNVRNYTPVYFNGNTNMQRYGNLSPIQEDKFEYTTKIDDKKKVTGFSLGNEGINGRGNSVTGDDYFKYINWSCPINEVSNLEQLPLRNQCCLDARNADISKLNISDEELLNLCIDKTTVLSAQQKSIIDKYMELGKNPGLGIRDLHKQGITGKGVKIAIIDQPLGKHKEYSDNIIYHEDINSKEMNWKEASLHGASVASIAVGKSVGVAPEADLVYFSAVNCSKNPKDIINYIKNLNNKILLNKDNPAVVNSVQNEIKVVIENNICPSNKSYAEAINKILDMNKDLSDKDKIPVISISWGFNEMAPGYEELMQAIDRAKKEGVFVVSTALKEHYGFNTNGANRNPKGDLESSETYEAGAFWKKWSENEVKDDLLLFPMDHRTVADFCDENSYRYDGNDGGMSWSTPWLAGMYVLAKQVNPNITPNEFWETALKTADDCHNNDSGVKVGKIINPKKLIENL